MRPQSSGGRLAAVPAAEASARYRQKRFYTGKEREKPMVKLTKRWKQLFYGCIAAVVGLVVLGFLLRIIVLFVLGLAAGCVLAVMSAAKLRCPNCGKVVFQEALKVKLEGQVVCPKCEKPITFE